MMNVIEKKPMYEGTIGIEKLHSQHDVYLIYKDGIFVGNVKNRTFTVGVTCPPEQIEPIKTHLRNYLIID